MTPSYGLTGGTKSQTRSQGTLLTGAQVLAKMRFLIARSVRWAMGKCDRNLTWQNLNKHTQIQASSI